MEGGLRVDYTIHIWKEGSQFVGCAMPLDVTSAGRTPDEARRAVSEAVRLFLEESQRMGTLQDILREEGFVPRDGSNASWSPPPLIATEHMRVAF